MLTVRLLGSFDVRRDGQPIELGSRKAQSLFAYLILSAGVECRREKLAGLFWPEADERLARKRLRHTLWQLRRKIGEAYFRANRIAIAFDETAPYRLDVSILQGAVRDEGPADALLPILTAYRGDLLPGFYDEWVLRVRRNLRLAYEQQMALLLKRLQAEGRWREMKSAAAAWLAHDELAEPAYRALMTAHSRLGANASFVEAFHACRAALRDGLDVAPSAETQALYRQLVNQETPRVKAPLAPPMEQPAPAASPLSDPPPPEVPPPATAFVGREEELQTIRDRLANPYCRLLSLVGPGGIGKTRLAMEAARLVSPAYRHGVCFVPLAALPTANSLAPAIANSLRFRFHGDEPMTVQLRNYLRHKTMLLLLDNLEHLLDGPNLDEVTGLALDILNTAPDVTILVTTRRRLQLQEEWLLELAGLPFLPPGDLETDTWQRVASVRLFLDRARRLDPVYEPNRLAAAEVASIVRICRLTAGNPLAIELAAAWVRHLTVKEIAEAVDRSYDALIAPWRNAPDRHASLRAVFDHSWALLTADEKRLLRRLTVFRGGFLRPAAADVAAATQATLSSLVDCSLLQRADDGRYLLHEMVREFAAEKLADRADEHVATCERHGHYYCRSLQHLGEELVGEAQLAAMRRIEGDLENIRAAWHWAADHGHADLLAKAAFGLGIFYQRRGKASLGLRDFEAAANQLASGVPAGARALALARLRYWQGLFSAAVARRDYWQAMPALLRAGAGEDTPADEALCYLVQGFSLSAENAVENARANLERAYALADRANEAWLKGRALDALADLCAFQASRLEEAMGFARQALALHRSLGDTTGIVSSLSKLSQAAALSRRYAEAVQLADEALKKCRQLDSPPLLAETMGTLSWALLISGEITRSLTSLGEMKAIYEELGYQRQARLVVMSLAWRNMLLLNLEQAERFAQQILRWHEEQGEELSSSAHGMALSTLSGIAFCRAAYDDALALAHKAHAILLKSGSHNQVAVARVDLAHASLALGDREAGARQAQTLMAMGGTYGIHALHLAAVLLAQAAKTDEEAAQAIALLALQRQELPMSDAPFFHLVVERLLPPRSEPLEIAVRPPKLEPVLAGLRERLTPLSPPV